jgi:hypothetical protein
LDPDRSVLSENGRPDAILYQAGDLPGVGMATQAGFGEDQVAVESHFEAALGRGQQLNGLDDRRPVGQEFIRQTDGTGDVVSGNAELDQDSVPGVEHRFLLLGG